MARTPIPTWAFALVLVRLGRRVLLVHERKHGQLWYLPAGRVEPGETLMQAAIRETMEESGVEIVLDGILAVEHSPSPDGAARLRVIFVASPKNDEGPRTVANEHSLGAAWMTIEEIASAPLRGSEVREIAEYVLSGKPIYPLSLLKSERDPWIVV